MKSLSPRPTLFRLALFTATPGSPGPFHTVVRGFSTHNVKVSSLPQEERDKVDAAAQFVADSFEPGAFPVLSVKIVGHADNDPRGARFEQTISADRAKEVQNALSAEIGKRTIRFVLFKTPAGMPTPRDIRFDVSGVGAKEPDEANVRKNPASLTESERKRNRRVDIILEPSAAPVPALDLDDLLKLTQKTIQDMLRNLPLPKPPNTPGPPPPRPPKWWKLPLPGKPDPWRDFVKEVQDKLGFLDVETIIGSMKNVLAGSTDQAEEAKEMLDDFMTEWRKLEEERRRRQNVPGP